MSTPEFHKTYEDESDLINMFNTLQGTDRIEDLPDSVISMTGDMMDFESQPALYELDTPRREQAIINELLAKGY